MGSHSCHCPEGRRKNGKAARRHAEVRPGNVDEGFLQEDAEIGDEVTVETAVGRLEKGVLIEVNPYWSHSYGKFVPELVQIDKQLREIMFGGDR